MTSRIQGRDYTTIRKELISIVQGRVPSDWNAANVADPLVAIIEAIAIAADELHYYIDSWRRECDMATAMLQSSIYSYALREGYSMILPRGARVRAFVQPKPERGNDGTAAAGQSLAPVPVSIPKFSRFQCLGFTTPFYAVTDFDRVVSYYDDKVVSDQCFDLVAGELKTVSFQYSAIDAYSRIELPEAFIDNELFELTVTTPENGSVVWRHVNDVVTAGMQGNIYSLVPSFVSGATRLYIELPMNYRNLLSTTRATFTFRYIAVSNVSKPLPITLQGTSVDSEKVELVVSNDLAGYMGYETADSVRRNYPKYTRDFTALLTKQDYRLYLSYRYGGRVLVYDKQDEYDSIDYENGIFGLMERSIYVVSELPYAARELARQDLASRSSRSDMIWMVPMGYYRYGILIVVYADLSKVSEEEIETLVSNAVLGLYNGTDDIRYPTDSVTLHTVHETSEYISSATAMTFRFEGSQYQSLLEMDKPSVKDKELAKTLKSLTSDYAYQTSNRLPKHVCEFSSYQEAVLKWNAGYDSEDIDNYEEGSADYDSTHFLIPFCQSVLVWSYSK